MNKPLAEQTPSEIDVQLAALYESENKALNVVAMAKATIHRLAGDRQSWGAGRPWGKSLNDCLVAVETMAEDDQTYRGRNAYDALVRLEEATNALTDVREQAKPLNEEFTRRGGWTRAFLATSSTSPHVHNGMGCSTCNKMGKATQFGWFPQYSGKPESEIVEDAGERACTTCYPSAPVGTLSRPTKFLSEDEVAKAVAREERLAKRAKADAEKIVVEDIADGSTLHTRSKTFKSLRAAVQYAASQRASVLRWGMCHPCVPVWNRDADKVEQAIAAKTGQSLAEVHADIVNRAAASHRRTSR